MVVHLPLVNNNVILSCLQDNLLLKKYSELESQTFILPTHAPTVCLSNSYVNRNIWMQSSQMRSRCAGTKEKSRCCASVSHKETQQEVITKHDMTQKVRHFIPNWGPYYPTLLNKSIRTIQIGVKIQRYSLRGSITDANLRITWL